jgi:fucose permease
VLLAVGIAFVGLSYGPIFPIALAIAGDRYTNTGTVFGLLFSVALIGGMVSPWTAGQMSQQFGVRTGMLVPLIGAVDAQERPDPRMVKAGVSTS